MTCSWERLHEALDLMSLASNENGHIQPTKSALARTARLLMDGFVYVPEPKAEF